MITLKELLFKFEEQWKTTKVILKYFVLHPYYELKQLLSGAYRSTLVFYFSAFLFFWMWKKGVLGRPLKIMGILVFLTYFYMFIKSAKWKEYDEKAGLVEKQEK